MKVLDFKVLCPFLFRRRPPDRRNEAVGVHYSGAHPFHRFLRVDFSTIYYLEVAQSVRFVLPWLDNIKSTDTVSSS